MSTFERQAREDRVAERLRIKAESAAELTARERAFRALEFFNTSPAFQAKPKQLIDKLLVHIYDKEYSRALSRFPDERERGLHNDPESLGPGLTALVTKEAVTKFESMLHTGNSRPGILEPRVVSGLIDRGFNDEKIDLIRGKPITDEHWQEIKPATESLAPSFLATMSPDLYSLKLSAGAYRQVGEGSPSEGLVFHTYATFQGGVMINSSIGFKLPSSSIVRVDGHNAGELWQNPLYGSNGQISSEE